MVITMKYFNGQMSIAISPILLLILACIYLGVYTPNGGSHCIRPNAVKQWEAAILFQNYAMLRNLMDTKDTSNEVEILGRWASYSACLIDYATQLVLHKPSGHGYSVFSEDKPQLYLSTTRVPFLTGCAMPKQCDVTPL